MSGQQLFGRTTIVRTSTARPLFVRTRVVPYRAACKDRFCIGAPPPLPPAFSDPVYVTHLRDSPLVRGVRIRVPREQLQHVADVSEPRHLWEREAGVRGGGRGL